MKFWIFVIFTETFLEQSIWICKWVRWWSYCLTIFHVFCILYNFENFHMYKSIILKICIYSFFIALLKHIHGKLHVTISKRLFIRANIILHLFRVDIKRQVLLSHSWTMGFSSFLWTKYMENYSMRRWHHQLTHKKLNKMSKPRLTAYSYLNRLFKKCLNRWKEIK